MFINLLRIAIIFFTFGTVDILDSYTLHSIDNIAYEELTYRDIFEQNDFGLYDLPNGVKTFEISENDLVQRVKKYVLQESDITALYTSPNNVDLVRFSRSLLSDYYSPSVATSTGGTTNAVGWRNDITENPSFSGFDDTSKVGIFTTLLSIYNMDFLVPKDTYSSLAEAQADFSGQVIYYQIETPIVLHTFTIAPTQTQLDEMLEYYLNNKDNPSYEYTFNTLGIEHLILFTTSMLFWYYSLKLLRKAVK